MKISLLKYTIGLLVSLSLFSCEKKVDAVEAPQIDAYLQSVPELSMFSKAMDKAGLESFKKGPGPFTWFAPSNAAFAAAMISEDSLNKMTPGQINYLLVYHLANTGLFSENMVAINSSPRNSQLGSGAGQFYIGSHNNENYINGSKIISRDNKISNGYIHIINRLNVPPVLRGTIQRILTESGQHTLFIQALTRAGLWTGFGGVAANTVFAPTDAAMTAAGYTITSITAAPVATISTAMRYHYIVNLRLFRNDLFRTSLPATAAGPSSTLTPSDNGTKIKGKNNSTPANIVRPDILGTNGVVHIIDAVLLR